MNTQLDTSLRVYLKEIGNHPILSKDEEYEIFDRLRRGDESVREHIVQSNLRLVVRLALKYRNKGVPLDDLIQEGNIGLMDVIDRFDHILGFRFSTYAAFWIRQSIQVAVRKQGSLIRLPVRKSRLLGRLTEIQNESHALYGRPATTEEIAAGLEIAVDQVGEIVKMARSAISLETPLDEDGSTLKDRVADEHSPRPADCSMEHEMFDRVHQVLGQLTERENRVLSLRYGLKGQKARSLRSVSRSIGLSQEGVRRVEQRALGKLNRKHMRNQLSGLI